MQIFDWNGSNFPGFDTASSIALLAVSAIAKRGSDGKTIPPANIIILPVVQIYATARCLELITLVSEVLVYSWNDVNRFR